MTLLSFFTQQRKLWQSQFHNQPADYVAGGLAALDQAETVFKAIPLYNAHQELAATQRELEEVSDQLALARKQVHLLGSQLGTMTQRASEVVIAQELLDNARLHRNRMRSARKVMRRILEAVTDQSMQSDAKLGKILELVRRFQSAVHNGEEELGDA